MEILIGYVVGIVSRWAYRKAKVRKEAEDNSWMIYGAILIVSDATAAVLIIRFWN